MMPTHSVNSPSLDRRHDADTARIGVQKVVVVNSNPETLALAERVLTAGRFDVVFVESIAHAYSQIRRIQPNLVILCLRLASGDGFQLLSMLKLDPDTRTIPVLTYTTDDPITATDEGSEDAAAAEFFAQQAAALMN